ncbi:NAD(P)/FAD-dependent oxidoreductase [Nocardioides limicola]|uniref:NAD(P)/FAD-dependent oxidoreductase n=1 Tax=Nocardioides limicola TaxID=2803368 RepID=UPI001EF13BB5|nr:FAD-dependent oxidoreductase [Nocardioides sp. DJM-14]
MVASIVIVGGGIAGVSTAAALRSGGYDGDLTLVDAGEFPYDRPPLSKDYLAGKQELAALALQPAEWYDDQEIRLANRTTVAALRPAEAGVELSDGTVLPADRVVLATGAHAARPPIPGATSDRVHVLRTAEDADGLRKALLPGARLLVVGGGLIGAEAASTALGLGCEVTLVDPLTPPLAAAVGEETATWLHDLHAERGISVLTAGVDAFEETAGGIAARLNSEHAPRDFDAVLLGVGMRAETTLAEAAGLEVTGGIVVDAGQTTSNPAVLAVGDPTRRRVDGVLQRPAEHWEAAQHDGTRAAATILGTPQPEPTAAWFWTDRHGLHVEGVGRMADAGHTVVRGTPGDGPFSVFAIDDGRVVGAVAVDDTKAVRASRRMIDGRLAVDLDDLADSGTDLRKLLRAAKG